MQKQGIRRQWRLAVVAACLLVGQMGSAAMVAAESSGSPNYRVNGAQFGAGSDQSCSDSYCAEASAGDTVVGETSSANYTISFDPNRLREPLIQVITLGGIQNLGVVDTDRTGTATNVVKIRDYSSGGYTIQLAGGSPTQGLHAITPLTVPSTSHPGAEQFGINLVTNTAPPIGDDPFQASSSGDDEEGEWGRPEPDYSTPNLFKYIDGDIIASSRGSNSETHYTISMILNVAASTPIGRYGGTFSVIVVPAF